MYIVKLKHGTYNYKGNWAQYIGGKWVIKDDKGNILHSEDGYVYAYTKKSAAIKSLEYLQSKQVVTI